MNFLASQFKVLKAFDVTCGPSKAENII